MKVCKFAALAMTLVLPLLTTACQETYHSETDKPGWFGGRKHEETSVRKNIDGSTTVHREKQTVNP